MMSTLTLGDAERFAPFNAKVAFVDIADRCHARNRSLDAVRFNDDHKVDHRFGRKTGYSGRANVFDREGEVVDRSGCALAEPLKLKRPRRVVLNDHDRIRNPVSLCAGHGGHR